MNERGLFGERLLRLSPLVLRLGVAAVLACHGLQGVKDVFAGQTDQQAVVSEAGVNVTAGWDTLVGAGELGVAALLVVGLLTRLTSLGLLAGIGMWARNGFGQPTAEASETVELATEGAGAGPEQLAMMLMAAVCVSLLVSGCGCLGLDRRLFGRKKQTETPL